MSDAGTIKSLYVLDISDVPAKVAQLRTLFSGIQQSATKAAQAGVSSAAAQGAALQQTASRASVAERQIIALARAQASNAQAAGQHAQAERILQSALAQVDTTTVEAINLSTKLLQVQNRLSNSKGPVALPRTLDGLSGSAANVAKGFLTIQAIERGFQFIKTGAEVADVTTSFDNLSKAAGTTGQTLLGSLRTASNSTITDAALIKSANLGLLLTQGRIAKDLPALTRIAQASAKATGQSVDFVFESLVKGISRGSAKIIDNAGITLDGEKAYATYALSIGKTADQLTKAEQQQAVLNAVVLEGNQIVKDAGINSEDASVKIAAAQTAVQNLLTALATKAAPVAGSIAGGITDLINTGGVAPGAVASGDALNANLVSKGQNYQQYAAGVVSANNELQRSMTENSGPFTVLINSYVAARLGLSALTPAQFAYAQSLIATGVSSAQAFAAAQRLTDVNGAFSEALRNSTDTARAHRAELEALAPKIFEVANQSDYNNTIVQKLLQSYADGTTTLPGLIEALAGLSKGHQIAAEKADLQALETRRLTGDLIGLTQAATGAASAVASVAGAAKLVPENRHIGGTGNTVGAIVGGIGAGAGAVSSRFDSEQQALQTSRDNLALARAKTSAQKIAIYQQQLARQTTEEGRNRILAQIEQEKRSGGGRVGAAQSTGLQLQNVEENTQAALLKAQREGQERLRDAAEDYNLSRSRKQEDENQKIIGLLARGQRAEANRERERFAIEQRRDAEDEAIKRRRTLRNNAESTGDTTAAADRRAGQIEQRAALRGATPTGGGGSASPASLGGAGTATGASARVISITFPSAIFSPDGQKLGDIVYPTIAQRLDDDLAIEIRSAPPMGGNQTAVAGTRP